MKAVIALILSGIMLLTGGGGNVPAASMDEYILIADCYRATVATVGGDGYSEACLYLNPDGGYEVHFFSKYVYDTAETHSAYAVDGAVRDELYSYIDSADMLNRAGAELIPGPGGAYYVFKFVTAEGEYIRLTSDSMPEDWLDRFWGASEILSAYAEEGTPVTP